MREEEHNPNGSRQGADFDRMLDAARTKYAAVEPRMGLEERILANLQAQPVRTAAWWRWSVAAAALAIITVVIGLAWRANRPAHPGIAHHPGTTIEPITEPEKQVAHRVGVPTGSPKRVLKHKLPHVRPEQVAIASPKLDQFPSPQPLNDQEKLLRDYVARYHEQAVLVARAREEQLQRDRAEEEAARGNHP